MITASPELLGEVLLSRLSNDYYTTADYARLAFTSATRRITRLPSARAARVIVSSVTDTF